MRLRTRSLCALAAGLALACCGIFGDDDELEPAELVDIDPKIELDRAWRAKVGGDSEFLRLALRPAGDGTRIYAASVDGKVSAFDPTSGDRGWRTDLEVEFTAGPGVGQERVVVVSADGFVIVLDATSGRKPGDRRSRANPWQRRWWLAAWSSSRQSTIACGPWTSTTVASSGR